MRLLTLGSLLLAAAAWSAPAQAGCEQAGPVRIAVSPRTPAAGAPMRLIAVAADAPPGTLVVRTPGRVSPSVPIVHRGGPPWSLIGTLAAPAAGPHRIEVWRGESRVACRELAVASAPAAGPPDPPGTDAWDAATTALYAAWIEHLFATGPGDPAALTGLADVLHDPERNFLHDHLGLGEDGPGPRALAPTPDCADLPYVLRAYFAWKLGLPFACRACGRGSAGAPPRCGPPAAVLPATSGVAEFAGFLRRVADTVHSGSARTALDDDATDFYPVALSRAALWPGTIYADPYGHTLVLVRWVPQTPEQPGRIVAIDAQPDESMGYKRFWEGTFLFAREPGAGPGWKAFRPLVADGGAPRPRRNDELDGRGGLPAFSAEQALLDADGFYARMAALIDPHGLSPVAAYEATLDALVEQLEARVVSVENGERWKAAHPGTVIVMPSGAAIFETTGAWEDFATPSRDLRLLIAMRVLEQLPERVERHPELFVLDGQDPATVRAELVARHTRRAAERRVRYTRSDSSPWTLSVADVLARRPALEVAYNPNDCVEIRWGAAAGSAEHSPCTRRAPAAQRTQMERSRAWFAELRRPPR